MTQDYEQARARRTRRRALVACLVFVLGVGWLLYREGVQRTAFRAQIAELDRLVARADYEGLKQVVKTVSEIGATNDRAPAEFLAISVRAKLLLSCLYVGESAGQLSTARPLMELALQRGPESPQVLVTHAVWEAVTGSPAQALALLENPLVGQALPSWQALVRSETAYRRGEAPDPVPQGTVLGDTWAMWTAWRVGKRDLAERLAAGVLAVVPDHGMASVVAELGVCRRLDGDAAIQRLTAMLEGASELPPVVGSIVAIELSRLLRRGRQSQRSDSLLDQLVGSGEGPVELQAEAAWVQRFRGNFGAARTRADKGLRLRVDDPSLLAEFAEAAFFNDDAAMIEARVRLIPREAIDGDGVIRARAVVSLLQGNLNGAIEGFGGTPHVGPPGDSDVWLAQTYLRAGRYAEAEAAALRAEAAFAGLFGETSREVAMAQMHRALAMQQTERQDEARRLMEQAHKGPGPTAWGAWLWGQFHEASGALRDAKDAYLLACHNGQDFALACYDLARIYESLKMSSLERKTQQAARRHYLRTSPKGVHAAAVTAALAGP